MKKILVLILLYVSIDAANAQVASFDTLHLKKSYVNDIFSTLFPSNPRSGLVLETGGSLNYAIKNPAGNGFRFRWLANDSLVNYSNDNDLVMSLHPAGDLIVKSSLAVGSMTGAEPVVGFKVHSNGNIGIGTSAPLHHLQMDVTTATVTNMMSFQNTATPNSRLLIGNAPANYAVVAHQSANVLESWTDLHVSAANSGSIFFETGRTATVAPIRMTILNNGNVGIGTATTGTNKLAVEGTIAARRIKVTQNNPWPDYVFHDSYQLPALKEVAVFIAANKHLSGIPAAADVEKDGQDLGEMNRKLLEKVEELTLYLIQEHKRNEEQQAQIDMLIRQLKQ